MSLRSDILIALYKTTSFSLKGDIVLDDLKLDFDVSCVINFFGRIDRLEGILYSLAEQDLPCSRYEVILVEDRGGSEEGRRVIDRFKSFLNIKYYAVAEKYGIMGYSRNYGLSKAKGKYILFLDDDTVILQKDFLSTMITEFQTSNADSIIPHGNASFMLLNGRYGYHEPFFPTSRGTAYQRDTLRELGGFVSDIVGQEDVELVIRFTAAGKKYLTSDRLRYYHPPLILMSLDKPAAVGYSFFKLKKRYPFVLWLLMLMNGSRHLPLLLFPLRLKWRMQGRFGLGFALGILYAVTGKKTRYQ